MQKQEILRARNVLVYTGGMAGTQVPLVVERDVDGFYVVECPVFEGCYTQGKTLDEALTNIREAIALALKEKKDAALLRRDLCAKLP